ncbi:hypothetical protein GHJ48_02995 [Acinetobacter sp. dk771]|uniref:Uncharacterized protein n=1 Tax=Acinetobacter wanghuae TaxID=2662362 RepID=A0AA90W513_9GAMM|nr:hypothetical protein [Acinetobacter wanghuae]
MKKRKDIFGRKIDLTKEERKSLQMVVSFTITILWALRFKNSYLAHTLFKSLKLICFELIKLIKRLWEFSIAIALPYFSVKLAIYLSNMSNPFI